MKRFDLDQLVMLVLMLATAMAVGIGFYSVRDEGGGAAGATAASVHDGPGAAEARDVPR